jgi:hypothetical protein
MRLLKRNNEGKSRPFSFITFKAHAPPYAILSHTWGIEDEEVTFRDLMDGTGKNKAGYNKIWFCDTHAHRDGLEYFWVDSCCIDKSSSAELSEAINSMFQWYRNATECYVYLSDVSMSHLDSLGNQERQPISKRFAKSRWFTRGWTLPELLAPKSVEFFSQEGDKLGNKKSLEALLCQITGIPDKALQGSSLSSFSVTERISWQENRETTRQEDNYYSLLGIFGVHMPVIYGEGREKAFRKLIEGIKVTIDDSSQLQNVPHYLPLSESGFRILQLCRIRTGNEITGLIIGNEITGLMQEYILGSQDYNALSYVWGHEPDIHRITVNNKPFFIRPNLFHALQRITNDELSVDLWVDSVCIDQSNEAERGAQVRRMADIFQNAKNVWIWLGEEDLTSKAAMELIPKIIDPDFRWDGVWWETHDFLAFDQLLARP